MLRKKRFFIGGIIVFLAIAYLAYTGFQTSATYYYMVSEFKEQANSLYGEKVRVNGEVVSGSVEREAAGRKLRFTMTEGNESLVVVYQGVVPDTFKEGVQVVAEGQLNADGVFQASTLMPKCPSRYEPQS